MEATYTPPPPQPKPIHLPVPRGLALMRGLRGTALAAVIGGLAWIAGSQIRWGLLRLDQPAAFYALASVFGLGGLGVAVGMLLSWRWLLLAAWPSELFIQISPAGIDLHLGPMGVRPWPWQDIDLHIEGELDEETIELIPDDLLLLRMTDRTGRIDLAAQIHRMTGIRTEDLNRVLRPYLAMQSRDRSHNPGSMDDG